MRPTQTFSIQKLKKILEEKNFERKLKNEKDKITKKKHWKNVIYEPVLSFKFIQCTALLKIKKEKLKKSK